MSIPSRDVISGLPSTLCGPEKGGIGAKGRNFFNNLRLDPGEGAAAELDCLLAAAASDSLMTASSLLLLLLLGVGRGGGGIIKADIVLLSADMAFKVRVVDQQRKMWKMEICLGGGCQYRILSERNVT
jgi:hypothetical protein